MQPSKKTLRQQYRAKRSGIAPLVRTQSALKAATHLAAHPLFLKSEKIACYLAAADEFDTEALIETIWQADKKCYLPVLSEAKSLQFLRYEKGDPLLPNQYAILEPQNHGHVIYPEKLQLVIVPLIAFDRNGHRLGTGGGYYDRTFAFLRGNPAAKPVMLGLAYACQEALNLPADPWDILLDGIITEMGIHLFNQTNVVS